MTLRLQKQQILYHSTSTQLKLYPESDTDKVLVKTN